MSILMHNLHSPNNLSLHPLITGPHRSQTNTVSNNTEVLNPLPTRQIRTQIHTPLHNPNSQTRLRLTLPIMLLKTTAKETATTRSSMHDIRSLVAAIIGARNRCHDLGIVTDKYDLTTCWVKVCVFDTAEEAGKETGAVYNYFGWLVGMVERCCFRDVLDNAAFYYYAVGEALSCEPGEVDGCVYANGCECCSGVYTLFQFGLVKDPELLIKLDLYFPR